MVDDPVSDDHPVADYDGRTGHDDVVPEDRIDRDDRFALLEDEPIEVVRERSFSFGQVLAMVAGVALVALGIAALLETGMAAPLNEPVESVLSWDHTPLLGIVEIVAGALLVLFSLRPGGRWLVALIGLALVVGGLGILAEADWMVDELGTEQGFVWVPIVVGIVAVLAALVTPRRFQRMTGVPVGRMTANH